MIRIQNKKAFLLTLIVAAIAFTVLVALVLPAMKDIKRLNEEMLVRRAELDRLYRQGQSIRKVTHDLDTIGPELARVHGSLSQKGEELAFITSLEGIAERHRLESRLEFATRDSSEKIANLFGSPIAIALAGSYQGVYRYITELESLPYYLIIQRLALSNGKANTRTFRQGGIGTAPNADIDISNPAATVTANLEAVIYWRE